MTLGLALGLLWAIPQPGFASALQAPSTRQQNGVLLMCSVLFLGCLYAANDFRRVGQIYRPPALRDAMYRDDPLLHAKQTWLFRNQAEFAELTTQALRLMHYSPEARVVKRVIDSGRILGLDTSELATRLRDVEAAKFVP
jgi:hypothetical protein